MFRRILVPVADCPSSEQSAQHATQLSRLLGCQLVFVHVLGDDEAGAPAARAAAQALLERLSKDARFPPILRLVDGEGLSVPERILAVAHEENADLIVMGTHGRQGLERLLLGSVTQAVAGSSDVPVQVIPLRVKPSGRFVERWRRALRQTT